ncbi:16291_t:CDS:2, partial [Gigaspora rosea]
MKNIYNILDLCAPSKQLNNKNKHEFSNSKESSSISSSQVVTNDHEISSLKTQLERLKAENERLQQFQQPGITQSLIVLMFQKKVLSRQLIA